MEAFRCYFVNDLGEIVASEDLSAAGVDMAIEIGFAALDKRNCSGQPPATSIEIWNGSMQMFAGVPIAS